VRVTLDIDEAILRTAQALARMKHQSTGRILSDLANRGLQGPATKFEMRNGIPVFPRKPGGKLVTDEDVKELSELDY
jgi:hypothetical protein